MPMNRFRDRSGLTTRRRVIEYLRAERERKTDLYPDRFDRSLYLVDASDNYFVDTDGNYFVIEESNGQASLI